MMKSQNHKWLPYVEYDYGVWWPKVSRKFGPFRITRSVIYLRASKSVEFALTVGSCTSDRSEAERWARKGADVKNGRDSGYASKMEKVDYV